MRADVVEDQKLLAKESQEGPELPGPGQGSAPDKAGEEVVGLAAGTTARSSMKLVSPRLALAVLGAGLLALVGAVLVGGLRLRGSREVVQNIGHPQGLALETASLNETIGDFGLDSISGHWGERVSPVEETHAPCDKTCDDSAGWQSNTMTLISGKKQLYFMAEGEPELGKGHSASRAVLVFHGVGYNPHKYLCYTYNGLKKAGGDVSDTYMISLAMISRDWMYQPDRRRRRGMKPSNTAYWGKDGAGDGRDWVYMRDTSVPQPDRRRRAADTDQYKKAYGDPDVASSQFAIDEVIKVLADKSIYPNLKKIIMLGHGGGGQMTLRYALANNVDPIDGVNLVYAIANPSSYVYLNGDRPTLPHAASVEDTANVECSRYDPFALKNRKWIFKEPNMEKIDVFHKASEAHEGEFDDRFGHEVNDWPFGLNNLPEFMNEQGMTSEKIRDRFIGRYVVFLSAYYDACNHNLQKKAGCGWCCHKVEEKAPESCEIDHHEVKYPLNRGRAAISQGLTRVERAWAYWEHLKRVYGHHGRHEFIPVMGKHSSCGIYQTTSVAKKLFIEL